MKPDKSLTTRFGILNDLSNFLFLFLPSRKIHNRQLAGFIYFEKNNSLRKGNYLIQIYFTYTINWVM